MEPLEPSLALLQPQDSAVAIVGELLATLPRENETLPVSAVSLYRDVEEFTRELRATLRRTDDTWGLWDVTDDDENSPTYLAGYESTPGTFQNCGLRPIIRGSMSLGRVKNSWDKLAKKATELRNTCREVLNEVADMVATAPARARELQAMAAHDGTAQENMVGLGQALGREEGAEVVAGREAQVRREARVAASQATRATMVRQRMEAALELLERLVAACDEAAAFPRELSRLPCDMEDTLEGRKKESSNVPEDLVTTFSVADWLSAPSAYLATDDLVSTSPFTTMLWWSQPPSPSTLLEQGRIFFNNIPSLHQSLDCPEGVPRESPESLELQELSPALLQPQVTMVATLGELLATLPRQDEEMLLLLQSAVRLYQDLEDFTRDLRVTLYCTEGTWWHRNVTSDDGDPVTSLSQVLAAYRSSPGTTWTHVTMSASKWHRSVSVLVDRWAQLAKKATYLPNTRREVASVVAEKEATATARARELQDEAARDGTAQENMVGLGQALGREEGDEVVAGCEAQERREAMVAASEATRATMVRQRVEVALGLLERLVAVCDEATAFPRELQRRVGDIVAALEGTNEASPDVPEDLVAQVAEAERLWEANARLAKDHLEGTLETIKFRFAGGCASPSACGVAERCQRAIEGIPRLLQMPESPQSVPEVSPMSLELQEVSPPQLLEALVAVVATLGDVAATVTGPHRGVRRCVPPKELHAALRNFTWSLRRALEPPRGTSTGDPGVPSLGQALATLGATPGTTWADVRAEGRAWRELVAAREERWKQLKEEITKLRDACQDAALAWARYQQDKATRRGTAGDSLAATAQQLMVARDRDEEASAGAARGAQVVAATNEAMGEAVVATRRARAATTRRHWAEVALEPLQRLVDACDKGTEFVSHMECQLRDIEAALEGTNDASLDVPEATVAAVAKFEQLWEASTCLFKHHLLGTLGNIHDLLLSPYDGRGGPSGPGSCAVAERCQRAIEDIPRLLRDSDITAAMS